MDEVTEQQARVPGVRYKKVRRFRLETTVIDGIPSTRPVPYRVWEPQPPREWDDVILRALTAIAVGFLMVAVVATAASIGGLLSTMVPKLVAYGMGAMFTLAWIYCLGIEWLNRVAPERARPAMVGGWIALLISMGAVYTYGNTLGHQEAGVVGAFIDLLAKGSWWLLLRHHAVPLSEGVAHWVTDREQQLAGRALLGTRIARLNRRAAYQAAIGGREFEAASAILTAAEPNPAAVTAPAPQVAVPVPAPVAPPVDPPVVPPTTPVQAAAVPPPTAPVSAPGDENEQAETAPVRQISLPSFAQICRDEIAADRKVTDAALRTAAIAAGHPDKPSLLDTLRRTAQRIDPSRKAS
jgi:hypothetical protein